MRKHYKSDLVDSERVPRKGRLYYPDRQGDCWWYINRKTASFHQDGAEGFSVRTVDIRRALARMDSELAKRKAARRG